ncbi:hypothetical protein D931_00379 [Enterococcus faecium 13.SD.W.09]|nr:hypothetical protein D931_00379 [Enterococcus faecium 13.SD.W.09]
MSLTCDGKLRTLGVANVGTAMHDFAKNQEKQFERFVFFCAV